MKVTKHFYFYVGEKIVPAWGMYCGNSMVIRGDDGRLTLVDPGPAVGPHLEIVKLKMRLDGLRFEDIAGIIVTHAHPDHAWAASRLARETGATLYAHELERRTLEYPDELWRDERKLLGGFTKPVLPAQPGVMEAISWFLFGPGEPVGDWTPLRDGDSPDLGTPAEIISFPGHRPGEIAVYLPQDRVLITGDLMNSARYDMPSINLPISNIDQAIESFTRISALEIDVVANGHERFTSGRRKISKWIEANIRRCEKMKRQAVELIENNPGISLTELGVRLIGFTPHVPLFELWAIPYNVLKSTQEGRAWIASKSGTDSNAAESRI